MTSPLFIVSQECGPPENSSRFRNDRVACMTLPHCPDAHPSTPAEFPRIDAIRAACRGTGLRFAFQPIFAMNEATVFGYEALLRPPPPWKDPLQLLDDARKSGLGIALELACCESAIRDFAGQRLPGKLLLNLGAPTMAAIGVARNPLLAAAIANDLLPSRIVVELTEREPILDLDRVIETTRSLRSCGLGIALDDYGAGYSGMHLWLEIQPDIIKIDRYFVSNLHASPAKCEAVRSMVHLAGKLGTRLLAEGIETRAELAILRDLGVSLAQGYLLGRPAVEPSRGLPQDVAAVLRSHQVAVIPEPSRMHAPGETIGKLLIPVPHTDSHATNHEVDRLFKASPQIHAIAVVDGGAPIGLINRQQFIDRLGKPFHREIYGKQPCTTFMNASPLVIEADTPLESLMQILSGDDQRYLSDGFIITLNGSYLGLGSGEGLVRAMSALRIEAARHANPLTFLPGNIPITKHIARLLQSGAPFAAAYADLDHFKPYNDQYGYWQGDEMIKLAAQIILAEVDPMIDFVGHVGGDDFVILLQSADHRARCEAIVTKFRDAARGLYNEEDRLREGLYAEDRHGNRSFFRLTAMSIGIVEIAPGTAATPEMVASRAAAAKRLAKKTGDCVREIAANAGRS